MKKRNVMTMALSLALVGVIGVGGTLAYLSDTTDKVENTFTLGDGIALELKEHVWNGGANYDKEKGEWKTDNAGHTQWDDGAVWGQANRYEDVVPNMVLPKDPTVKLTSAPAAGAEVYVLVDGVDATYMSVDVGANWKQVAGLDANEDGKYDDQNGIYQYVNGTDLLNAGDYAEFFSEVTFVEKTWSGEQADQTITLYAAAVQKDNLGEGLTATGEAIKLLNNAASTSFAAAAVVEP